MLVFRSGDREEDSFQLCYRIVGTPTHFHDPVITYTDHEPVSWSQPECFPGLARNYDLVLTAELHGRWHLHLLPALSGRGRIDGALSHGPTFTE